MYWHAVSCYLDCFEIRESLKIIHSFFDRLSATAPCVALPLSIDHPLVVELVEVQFLEIPIIVSSPSEAPVCINLLDSAIAKAVPMIKNFTEFFIVYC